MRRLAITMGDPAGVGAEIILKALNSAHVRSCCLPIVVGDAAVMENARSLLHLPMKLKIIESLGVSRPPAGIIEVIHVESGAESAASVARTAKAGQRRIPRGNVSSGNRPTAEGGAACVAYIKKAVDLALRGQVHGIVTAPISKEAMKMAGYQWPGHTEMIADLTDTRDFAMMLVGGPLRVILATIHTALRNVPDLVTKRGLMKTIRLAKKACEMMKIRKPRIAVAGLNPHAGETGIFGDEEKRIISPAIRRMSKEGIPVSGPYPPDTIFYKAYQGETDIIVCMYHDQGLIPLKMIAFETGVNVTVGLPFVRTSPDHGTAYDIAWKGIASPSSMIEAIRLAAKLRVP